MQSKKLILHEVFDSLLRRYGLFQPEPLYKVVCPFHGDRNPSLQINRETCFFYCYGCGASGSSYELIHYSQPELSSLKAMAVLKDVEKSIKEGKGDIGGRDVYTLASNNSIPFVESINYSEGIKLAKDFYYNLPKTNWYKPHEDVFHIKLYMKRRGFTTQTLIKAEAKGTYNKNYPIVFPMYDNGIFRGYVMRTDDPTVEDQRKYMYNRGFKRRITLAGDYKSNTVILVEGFLDKLAGNQLGFKNVAAVLGWKLTSDQFEKLKKRKIKTIICALDNDECGNKGYRYLKRICKANHISVKRVRYPKHIKDFGDLLKDEKAASNIKRQLRSFGAT